MMDSFLYALNEMLTTTYRSVCKVEELMLRKLSNDRLSLSEMHMLEAIGKRGSEGMTITEIAQDLEITPPSVTTAIKRLEKKGFVTKDRSSEDARRVHILLSREGSRAEIAHRYFHRKMVRAITEGLTREERDAILSGLHKMNGFMREQINDYTARKEE